MITRTLVAALSLSCLLQCATSQVGPDPKWLLPDGSKPDFSSAFTTGTDITLSWQALNNSRSDLYVAHFDGQTYPWYSQIATNVDISVANTLRWLIDVPNFTIQNNSKFVFHFFPANAPYGLLNFNVRSSPGFLLAAGVVSSSSKTATATATGGTTQSDQSAATSGTATGIGTSASTSTGSVTSISTTLTVTSTNAAGSVTVATIATAITTNADPSGSPQPTGSSTTGGGLSTGAGAGIGVGAGILVIVLFVGGCFFGRRYGKKRTTYGQEHDLGKEDLSPAPVYGHPKKEKTSMGDVSTNYRELGGKPVGSTLGEDASLIGSPWAEALGNYNYPMEKDGTRVKPGVHEIE